MHHGWIIGVGLLVGCAGDSGATSASATAATTLTTAATSASESASSSEGSSEGEASTAATSSSSASESEGATTETTAASGEPTTTSGEPTTSGSTTETTAAATDSTTEEELAGCKQVDFLFVIDNSVSMEGEQTKLAAAFPAFIQTIKETLPTNDYNIMVVDTDAAGRCSPMTCTHQTCQAQGKYACKDIFTACDTTRGAGVVHPAGDFASNKPCDFPPGQRYLVASDPALTDNFTCAAKVGTAGNASERPMDGMVAAVSPELLAPGACNEGFLREQGILVVTFISDDPNVEDQNTAQQTYDAMVAAKGGDTDRIVMLGLIPGEGCGNGGAHWAEMISLFGPRGIQGLVCADDYNSFFQDAVATILETCVINPG